MGGITGDATLQWGFVVDAYQIQKLFEILRPCYKTEIRNGFLKVRQLALPKIRAKAMAAPAKNTKSAWSNAHPGQPRERESFLSSGTEIGVGTKSHKRALDDDSKPEAGLARPLPSKKTKTCISTEDAEALEQIIEHIICGPEYRDDFDCLWRGMGDWGVPKMAIVYKFEETPGVSVSGGYDECSRSFEFLGRDLKDDAKLEVKKNKLNMLRKELFLDEIGVEMKTGWIVYVSILP